VNKLARREYDYIKGNTVLAPERKTRVRTPDKKYKETQRRKNIINKSILLRNNRKNDRKYMLTVAVIIIGLGFITISGDNKIYGMQNKVSKLNAEIKQTQEENEAIKVKLLKFSSLNNIEKNAESKLAMFVPKKEETVRIDFSQNYFKDINSTDTESNSTKSTLWSKLVNLVK
jgi:cell division protein FtsL